MFIAPYNRLLWRGRDATSRSRAIERLRHARRGAESGILYLATSNRKK